VSGAGHPLVLLSQGSTGSSRARHGDPRDRALLRSRSSSFQPGCQRGEPRGMGCYRRAGRCRSPSRTVPAQPMHRGTGAACSAQGSARVAPERAVAGNSPANWDQWGGCGSGCPLRSAVLQPFHPAAKRLRRQPRYPCAFRPVQLFMGVAVCSRGLGLCDEKPRARLKFSLALK